jgi:hypothetical protein
MFACASMGGIVAARKRFRRNRCARVAPASTVSRFEQELRELDFEPWRAALRTEQLIEYTPEIVDFPIQDLATGELYLSCVSRKGRQEKS